VFHAEEVGNQDAIGACFEITGLVGVSLEIWAFGANLTV
jgi:hypothetical protein